MSAVIDPYTMRSEHPSRFYLYALNPLAKIAAPLPAMSILLFTRDVWAPLGMLLLAYLVLITGARLTTRTALLLFAGMPLGIAVFSLTFGLWTNPSNVDQAVLLFRIGEFRFFLGSYLVGLATALRLGSLLALALIGGLTSTGPDVVRAMVQHLRVPYRIGYAALAAYRFIPRFRHELGVIRSAHRVRGIAGGRGPIVAVRRSLGYAIPLLAGAIRHAERVSLSMDSRAFGAHPTRTERHLVPFRTRDWLFIVLFLAATGAIFVIAGQLR